MNDPTENADHTAKQPNAALSDRYGHDYSRVESTARIALYDDMRAAPRIIEIEPDETSAYIENLASTVYEQARAIGGSIPYTVIREVSENFIHALFAEPTVVILDHGSTIRFSDQGPGIEQKEKAQRPAFTTAIAPMKQYIRGVGSGLPLVREYLEVSHGTITIEDNLGTGAVVTVSMHESQAPTPHTTKNTQTPTPYVASSVTPAPIGAPNTYLPNTPAYQTPATNPYIDATPQSYPNSFTVPSPGSAPVGAVAVQTGYIQSPYPITPATQAYVPIPKLDDQKREIMVQLYHHHVLGVTDIANAIGVAGSTVHSKLIKLEREGLVTKADEGRRGSRTLTDFGVRVTESFFS